MSNIINPSTRFFDFIGVNHFLQGVKLPDLPTNGALLMSLLKHLYYTVGLYIVLRCIVLL